MLQFRMRGQVQRQPLTLSTNIIYMPQSMLNHVGTLTEVAIDTATAATLEVIAATAGQTIRIYKIFLFCGAANTITLKNGSTNLMGAMAVTAGGGFVIDPDAGGHCPITLTSGNAFNILIGSSQQVSGRVWYIKE